MENDDIIPLRCMLWPTIAVLAAVLGIAAMIYVVYQSYRQDYPLGQLSAESGSVH